MSDRVDGERTGKPGGDGAPAWRTARPLPLKIAISLALAASVIVVYGPAVGHPFTLLDDNWYVYGNPRVLAGLTAEGVSWAFTTIVAGNWHPLTMISHMADVSAFGLDPAGHHAVSVLLHAANAVVLFLLLAASTGRTWPAALAAAIFAIHPLRVESVAWISERKDVLSTLFFLLASLAYVRYARSERTGRYLLVAFLFSLGLLSKASTVTFPLAMLLLDRWPLGRERPWSRLLAEKAPLFLLSAAASAATIVAMRSAGGLAPQSLYPWTARFANAAASCGSYVLKTTWPASLAPFYPHPYVADGGIPAGRLALSLLFLAGATLVAVRERRRRPYIAVGWFWFLATLIPMAGFLQAGGQGMADRYTYIPGIGLAVIAAWGAREIAQRSTGARRAVAVAAAAALIALGASARIQVGYWRSDVTLFTRAVEAVPRNWLGHFNLGLAYHKAGRLAEASSHYEQAIAIYPFYADAYYNLGMVLLRTGDPAGAAIRFERVLRLRPADRAAWAALRATGFGRPPGIADGGR